MRIEMLTLKSRPKESKFVSLHKDKKEQAKNGRKTGKNGRKRGQKWKKTRTKKWT